MRKIFASALGTALAIGSVHATDLKGTVLLPDGKPAAGAEVGAFIPGQPLSVRLHMLQDPVNKDRVMRADDHGSFSFSPAGEATDVYATHELGYAKVTIAALAAATNRIVLQPWGRIEGVLTVGGEPKSDWWIQIDGGTPVEPIQRDFTTFGVRTDAAGRFILSNVPPGQWFVGRYVLSRQGDSRQDLLKTASVKPGELLKLQLAADGRTVVGKLTIKTAPPGLDWHEAVLVLQGWRWSGNAKPDGTFSIEGVPPGTNELSIQVVQNGSVRPSPGSPLPMIIAEGKKSFVVPVPPSGASNELFNLGTIELKPVNPPRVAPRS